MLFPSRQANQRERGNDDSSNHICVLAAPAVDIGKWGEQMSEAQRTGKEMKEEITEEDNVVCLPVATIQACARHLATPQLLREVEWWDFLLNPVPGFICPDVRCHAVQQGLG